MKFWRIENNALKRLRPTALAAERDLHHWLEQDIALLDPGLLVIGSEVPTAHGGRIDLLAVDVDGALSIIELKRDRTPRDIVAQALDYASWVAELESPAVHRIAEEYWHSHGSSFVERFTACFDAPVPEHLNANHRIVIVASTLDPASTRIVEYLSERHGIGINTAFFSVFQDGDQRFLAADWLMDQSEVAERTERHVRSPWSGDFYVNVGEGAHRCWADMRQYGFIAAGHGRPFIDDIKRLAIGAPVWAYQKGRGYVGYGVVTEGPMMARDARIGSSPLLELSLQAPGLGDDRDDPEMAEYVALVHWHKTYALEQARSFKGIFANQHAVCRLTEPTTLAFLRREFGVEDA